MSEIYQNLKKLVLEKKELILVDKLQDKQLENNYYFLPKNFK